MLTIRHFKKGFDEDSYLRIYNTAFSDYDDIRHVTPEEMKKMETSPGYTTEGCIIAEWNGEVAGMVDAHVDPLREEKKGFIQNLSVLPQFRRKGIARKLVEKALESLKQRGMETVETWAQSDREGCVHIYESFGFKAARYTSLMKRSLRSIPRGVGENTDVAIRDLSMRSDADIELLNRLDNETFKEHHNFRPRTLEETKYALFDMPWFDKQAWFFAETAGQPVGYAGGAIDEGLNKEKGLKWGWIWDIGVLKSHRRKGVATRLMIRTMEWLKGAGMEEAMLYVDDLNPMKAIELYWKLGFNVHRKSIICELRIA